MTSSTLPKGFLLQGANQQYCIEKMLGQGSFGITYLAQYKTKVSGVMGAGYITAQVCIKEFFMKDFNTRDTNTGFLDKTSDISLVSKYRKAFIREAKNLAKINHSGIVNIFEIIEANNTVYIVMEYISGGSLDDFIKENGAMSESDAIPYFLQICKAVEFLHRNKMLHLDIKPKNVMLDEDGHLYLIDFGLSKQYTPNGLPETSTTIGLGTPGYAPIEQANQQDDCMRFHATIDIYALGGTLYKMLTGTTPPIATTVSNCMLEDDPIIKKNLLKFGISKNISNIVTQAMWPSSKKRIQSVSDLIALLNDQTNISKPTSNPIAQKEETIEYNVYNNISDKESYSLFKKFITSQRQRLPFVTIILCILQIGALCGFITFTYFAYLCNFDWYKVMMSISFLIFSACNVQTFRWKQNACHYLTIASILISLPFIFDGNFFDFEFCSILYLLIVGVYYLILRIRKSGESSWSLSKIPSKIVVWTTKSCFVLWLILIISPYFIGWHNGFRSNIYQHGTDCYDANLGYAWDINDYANDIATSEDYIGDRNLAEKYYEKALSVDNQISHYREETYINYILFSMKYKDIPKAISIYDDARKEYTKESIFNYIKHNTIWSESMRLECLSILKKRQ